MKETHPDYEIKWYSVKENHSYMYWDCTYKAEVIDLKTNRIIYTFWKEEFETASVNETTGTKLIGFTDDGLNLEVHNYNGEIDFYPIPPLPIHVLQNNSWSFIDSSDNYYHSFSLELKTNGKFIYENKMSGFFGTSSEIKTGTYEIKENNLILIIDTIKKLDNTVIDTEEIETISKEIEVLIGTFVENTITLSKNNLEFTLSKI